MEWLHLHEQTTRTVHTGLWSIVGALALLLIVARYRRGAVGLGASRTIPFSGGFTS